MKRINQLVNRLASIGSDKYLHLLACQAIAYIVSKIAATFMSSGWALLSGIFVASVIGVAKELRDWRQTGNKFSWEDICADLGGAIIGAVMIL